MTSTEMLELAKRKAVVRWTNGHNIEQTVLVGGTVRMVNIVTGKGHPLLLRDDYFCTEVELDAMIRVGDLLPKGFPG